MLDAVQVEKHWTEKALEDMAERDWRIFREDFNIGYKGVNTVGRTSRTGGGEGAGAH